MSEPRPLWLTAAMAAGGVIVAPLAILGLAFALGASSSSETTRIAIAYFGFLGVSIVASVFRAVRPLGLGMATGTVALALMFLVQGGTNQ